MRIPPGTTVDSLQERINSVLRDYSNCNPKTQVSYERIDCTEPYLSPTRTIIAKALASAIYKARGTQVTLVTKTGTGDMNVFGHETGIPSITYGPGDSHYDHTSIEQIRLRDYLDSVEILTKAIILFGDLYEKRSKTPQG
jgi:LysW-gamma-L-lysine carboxypeptidase